MLARSVIEIIKKMGFVFVTEDRWTAEFMDSNSRDIFTFIAHESDDLDGFPRLVFTAMDKFGNIFSTNTLDQIMLAFERGELNPVPAKSNKKYRVSMLVEIETVIDMDTISPETYRMYIEDGCTEETEVANSIAKSHVTEYCSLAPFNITDIDFKRIEEVPNV